jgi:hypothetical protein
VTRCAGGATRAAGVETVAIIFSPSRYGHIAFL